MAKRPMYAKAPQSQAEHEELQTEQNGHGHTHNVEAYHDTKTHFWKGWKSQS